MNLVRVLLLTITAYAFCQEQWHEASPHHRWLWDQWRFGDPKTGVIPLDAAERDRAFAEHVIRSVSPKQVQLASVVVEPIGPTNVAGRIRALALDRRSPSVLICGGVTGGVWRSIDGGLSWVRTSSPTLVPHVSCIHQSTSDPDTWFIGTGEGLSTTERRTSTQLRTVGTGTGVFRSTDNGTTWHSITPRVTRQPNALPAQTWQIVWRLTSRSENGREILYAACYGGIFSWDGQRWQLELGDTTAPAFCSEIIAAGDRLYAAIGATDEGNRSRQYGIFVWSATRGWQNITPANFPTARRIVLAASADGSTLYAFTQQPQVWSQRYMSFASQHTLWRYSALSGQWSNRSAWLQLLTNPNRMQLETLAGYAMALAVHPQNPNVVYLGSTDLFVSHDGCQSSAVHLGGYPYRIGTLHPDLHAFVFDPTNPNLLYVATDGGIYRTSSALATTGVSWQPLNTGLTTTQAYHVAIDQRMKAQRLVIAGFQDNSCWYTQTATYGDSWKFAYGGDGCRVLVGDGEQLIFSSSQFGTIYALSAVSGELLPLPQPPQQGSVFVTEFAYSPSLRLLVIALDNMLYRIRADANGFGPQWERTVTLPSDDPITAIALAYSDVAIVGTATGKLYACSVLDGNVEQIPAPLPPGGFIAAIDLDRNDPRRMIVTISNYTLPSIFATWDGGATWQSVGGSLDQEQTNGWGPSVRVVRSLYRNGKRLYIAGTSVGVFIADTLDQATSWQPFGLSTLGVLPVEAIDTRDADGWTVIGTHGGGVFACFLNPESLGADTPPSPTTFFVEQCSPQPVRDIAVLRVHVPSAEGVVECELFDAVGRHLTTRRAHVMAAGVVPIIFSATELEKLPAGTYFYRVRWNQHIASGAFVRQTP